MIDDHNPLTPPDGTALGDEVYSVLGGMIVDGSLAPGERLRDVELAERLGISRTPVREALQRLQRIGLIEVSANRYTRVSDPDEELVGDAHEYFAYTVGMGLRMSLPRCSADELDEMLELADAIIEASASDDDDALTRTSGDLYQFVGATSGNRVYRRLLREADLFFRRTVEAWTPWPDDPDERTASLHELRAAIADRDGERAEHLVRAQSGLS